MFWGRGGAAIFCRANALKQAFLVEQVKKQTFQHKIMFKRKLLLICPLFFFVVSKDKRRFSLISPNMFRRSFCFLSQKGLVDAKR
eukprot:UN11940